GRRPTAASSAASDVPIVMNRVTPPARARDRTPSSCEPRRSSVRWQWVSIMGSVGRAEPGPQDEQASPFGSRSLRPPQHFRPTRQFGGRYVCPAVRQRNNSTVLEPKHLAPPGGGVALQARGLQPCYDRRRVFVTVDRDEQGEGRRRGRAPQVLLPAMDDAQYEHRWHRPFGVQD